MTDDELRTALARAHEDDRPPAFAATLATTRTARRPRPRMPVIVALVATVALAVVALRGRRSPTPAVPAGVPSAALAFDGFGMRSTSLRLPTDSLLAIPDENLLSSPPRLDQGALP